MDTSRNLTHSNDSNNACESSILSSTTASETLIKNSISISSTENASGDPTFTLSNCDEIQTFTIDKSVDESERHIYVKPEYAWNDQSSKIDGSNCSLEESQIGILQNDTLLPSSYSLLGDSYAVDYIKTEQVSNDNHIQMQIIGKKSNINIPRKKKNLIDNAFWKLEQRGGSCRYQCKSCGEARICTPTRARGHLLGILGCGWTKCSKPQSQYIDEVSAPIETRKRKDEGIPIIPINRSVDEEVIPVSALPPKETKVEQAFWVLERKGSINKYQCKSCGEVRTCNTSRARGHIIGIPGCGWKQCKYLLDKYSQLFEGDVVVKRQKLESPIYTEGIIPTTNTNTSDASLSGQSYPGQYYTSTMIGEDVPPLSTPCTPNGTGIEKVFWVLDKRGSTKKYQCKSCGDIRMCGSSRARGHLLGIAGSGWAKCPRPNKEYYELLMKDYIANYPDKFTNTGGFPVDDMEGDLTRTEQGRGVCIKNENNETYVPPQLLCLLNVSAEYVV